MAQGRTLRVAVVGAGPRGTSVLERLLAHAAAGALDGNALDVTLLDPFPAGPGHVWRTDQSRLYLMNTQSFYPTVVPDRALEPPAFAGCTFEQWRSAQRKAPDPSLTTQEVQELGLLGRNDFPSRPLYGRYLDWCLRQCLLNLPDGVTVRHRAVEVAAVARSGSGFVLTMPPDAGEPKTLAVDAVVLALGHIPSVLSAAQKTIAESAARHSLAYFPPAVPNDVDWNEIPAKERVLIRGLGLNFFDILGQLTEGRGGSFAQSPDGLVYRPSGREPEMVVASRRGVPYRAKAALGSYYPRSVQLRYLTEEAVAALAAAGLPGFDHDLWPLLHRDALWAYYSTLARIRPAAVGPSVLAAVREALDDGDNWERKLAAAVEAIASTDRLDLEALARPLGTRHFADQYELDHAVVQYLDDDARGSAAGEDDPVKMAIGALNAGRAVLKTAVADGGITEESWLGELRGWFENYVEGLASGPPALRIEQLAAVARAGIVHFTGPDPVFGIDEKRGVFVVSSPWVREQLWSGRVLVEAMAPTNRVLQSRSPLLAGLLEDGLARPKIMIAADGEPVATTGLDVSAPPYRAIAVDGSTVEHLYVLGLQLSSVQWGNAIAAQAEAPFASGYRTLADADAIARDILACP